MMRFESLERRERIGDAAYMTLTDRKDVECVAIIRPRRHQCFRGGKSWNVLTRLQQLANTVKVGLQRGRRRIRLDRCQGSALGQVERYFVALRLGYFRCARQALASLIKKAGIAARLQFFAYSAACQQAAVIRLTKPRTCT